ncbi:AraC family transcriptional regulator [Alteraurantiacibacter aquimixticola]|nr:AraC family transcriptional regulator [Alteraurantiacibacter aquimixticola]
MPTPCLAASTPGLVEPAHGLGGATIGELLQGAVLQGHDPHKLLEAAGIDPAILNDPAIAIGGRDFVRLVRQVQIALDDVYLGFLPQGSRLALEDERILCLLQAANLGEAIRFSVRFTNAMTPDVGAQLFPEACGALRHACAYRTIPGVNRAMLVWVRFIWIYQFFGWLIGRPLKMKGLSVSEPGNAERFDPSALFGCPVTFGAPEDMLTYDMRDLNRPLLRRSVREYQDYCATEPDWFAADIRPPDWTTRTRKAIIDLQRLGSWFPTIEQVADRVSSSPRQLRHHLSQEGENFQNLRTRLRGEAASAYLLASDLPIQEIGMLLGFSEPGSFSRHFISWAGTSPSDYRAQHIGDAGRMANASALLAERRPLRIIEP